MGENVFYFMHFSVTMTAMFLSDCLSFSIFAEALIQIDFKDVEHVWLTSGFLFVKAMLLTILKWESIVEAGFLRLVMGLTLSVNHGWNILICVVCSWDFGHVL